MMSFKNRIKKEREARKLTKGEMADLLGIHIATYSKWEQGESPSSLNKAKVLLWLRDHPVVQSSTRWTSTSIQALYNASNATNQTEFAKMLDKNLSQSTVSAWMLNKYAPNIAFQEKLDELARKLGFALAAPEPESGDTRIDMLGDRLNQFGNEFVDIGTRLVEAIVELAIESACNQIQKTCDDAIAKINAAADSARSLTLF